MEKFHLIGIKGTGMSALASILKDFGYIVTGSDVEEDYFTTKKLESKKINYTLFNESNITSDKTYIASSCYDNSNIEVREVNKKGYPLYYYHEFIEMFFKNKIGVAGTHGKTTTTSLLAKLFQDKKITYLIGDGTGGGVKDYDYFIFEACEYQDHFLNYNYEYLIITNVDYDHPDYFKTMDDVIISFQEVAKKAKNIIMNNDDINSKLIEHKSKLTFGFSDGADLKATILKSFQNGYSIKVDIKEVDYCFFLPFTGKHMIYNFLAALSIYYLNGYNLNLVQDMIITYKKPARRMEEHYYFDNIIIDDYAHHPKEIEACINAIEQKYPTKDLVIIFQPHTYSRTLALKNEFRNVFVNRDLYLVKTFTSKREGKNKELEKEVFKVFTNAKMFKESDIKTLKKLNNKVILFLGAGNINSLINKLIT